MTETKLARLAAVSFYELKRWTFLPILARLLLLNVNF